jgi:hypothetical protein
MAIKTTLKRVITLVFGLAFLTVVWSAAAIAITSYRTPQANTGTAYKIGIQHGLTADHAHTVWSGKTPAIVFRRREHESSNNYVWEKANLSRPGNCLDLKPAANGSGYTLSTLCRTHDKIEENANRFYFSVSEDRAIRLGVGTKPPSDDRIEARGAMYGIEGEIAFGATFETASVFKIELTAAGLNIADLLVEPSPGIEPTREGDAEAGGCGEPRTVRLDNPIALWLLPPTAARICSFKSKDNKVVLSLVQYQRGWMQRARWSDEIMCRALLAALLDGDRKRDSHFAGCLGAHWNELSRIDVNLMLFETPEPGRLARLLY